MPKFQPVIKETSLIILDGEIKKVCKAEINTVTGNISLGACSTPAPLIGTMSVYAGPTVIGWADTKMLGEKQIFLMKPGDLYNKEAFEEHQKKEWKKISEEVGYD